MKMQKHANVWQDMFIHRIMWQRKEVTQDQMGGGEVTNWPDVKEIEALVQPISGDEWYVGEQSGLRAVANIYFPPMSGFSEDMRIKHLDTGDIYTLESQPLDQGGQGEVMMVKASRGALGDA